MARGDESRAEMLDASGIERYSWDPPECWECAELFDPWEGWCCDRCAADLCDACPEVHAARCREQAQEAGHARR